MLFDIPYRVRLYQSLHDKKPRVTSTGLVHWEFDNEQMALLDNEKGKPDGKYTKWFRESVTDYLRRYVTDRLERENGMGDYALPVSSKARAFVLITPTKVTLRGTPASWQIKKETIHFTGKVEFCVTAEI
jgi:hypothetical protein